MLITFLELYWVLEPHWVYHLRSGHLSYWLRQPLLLPQCGYAVMGAISQVAWGKNPRASSWPRYVPLNWSPKVSLIATKTRWDLFSTHICATYKLWGVNILCGQALTNQRKKSVANFFFIPTSALAVWRSSGLILPLWIHSTNLRIQKEILASSVTHFLMFAFSSFLPHSCFPGIGLLISFCLKMQKENLGSFFSERDKCLVVLQDKSQWYNVMSARNGYRSLAVNWGTILAGGGWWVREGFPEGGASWVEACTMTRDSPAAWSRWRESCKSPRTTSGTCYGWGHAWINGSWWET